MKARRKTRLSGAVAALLLAVWLIGGPVPAAYATRYERGGYNSEYIYAMTRGLNQADMPAALKVTLFPVTIILDTALLPFEAIAGLVT